jgi:hypothetical protein
VSGCAKVVEACGTLSGWGTDGREAASLVGVISSLDLGVASSMLSEDVAATNRAYSEGELNASVASLSWLVDIAGPLELLCNW